MMTPERLAEIERLCVDVLNDPTDRRPPYGDTSGRFYLESGRAVVANLEHAECSQQNQDTLFVELRMACDEVRLLRSARGAAPELLAEVRRLQGVVDRLANNERDLAETNLVLGQQDRDLERQRARISALETGLREACDRLAVATSALEVERPGDYSKAITAEAGLRALARGAP